MEAVHPGETHATHNAPVDGVSSLQWIRCNGKGTGTRAVDDVPDGLETGAADGPLVLVERVGLAVEKVEHHVAAQVEDRVDARREERQRHGRDCGVHCGSKR